MKIKLPRITRHFSKIPLFSILFFILDRIFKLISLDSGFPVINRGMAFGLFPDHSSILFGAGLSLLIYACSAKLGQGVLLILFGGLSNLLDRIFYKGVVDYIRLGYIFPAFNLADVLIIAGCLMVGWQVLHSHQSGVGVASKPRLPF